MDKSEKFWDKQAKDYSDDQQKIDLSKNKDFITTLKYLNTDQIVLDYGCATGIVSNAIADKVKEIQGIDISPKMIEIAKRTASERYIKNIKYAQATIYDERFQKESFDVVLAFRILHVLENPQAAVHRINELLKPGGVFISVTTCMGAYRVAFSFIASLLKKLGIFPVHLNWFKLQGLQEIITEGGFQIAEYEKMDDRIACYCIIAKKL